MTNKHSDTDRPYRLEDHSYGPPRSGDSEPRSWTDGLPHDFKGWGPQTPDPGDPVESASSEPNSELHWDSGEEPRNHHVWHFDGRRRHHH